MPYKQLLSLISLLRPKQWLKNAFVLAPLLFSGEFLYFAAVKQALLATLLFCLASSLCYIINDLHDIEADRLHPKKSKSRPLAAGTVSISTAYTLLLLLSLCLICSGFLFFSIVKIIIVYLALNLAYTFVLKKQPVLDIFSIAIGFVLRVYAGAAALTVPLSHWMFITTLCLALYLASIKRGQELKCVQQESRRQVLSEYSLALIDRYAQISATGSLVFYSLFVMSTKPQLLNSIPLVLFGLFRYWYVVEVRHEGESPTDALLNDWQLMLTILLWIALCAWTLFSISEIKTVAQYFLSTCFV